MADKIVLTGTSCVGKTTLISMLERYYDKDHRVTVVHEAARQFFIDNPYGEQERFTASVQKQLRKFVEENERVAVGSGATYIFCDNSPIAAAAFTAAAGNLEAAYKMLAESEQHLRTYKKAYLLDPRDVAYKPDAIRKETKEFRDKVHQHFIDMYDHLNIEFVLLGGEVEERLAILKQNVR